MPFIRGRYYANPVAGGALEAAREAEEALLASQSSHNDDGRNNQSDTSDTAETKPVNRIEIEVAEFVPAHSGHGTTGYIARLHRGDSSEPDAAQGGATRPVERVFYDQGQLVNFLKNELAKNGTCR
jgi:hypothetical protein